MKPPVHLPYEFADATERGAAGEQRWKVVTVQLCQELFSGRPAKVLDFGSGRGELLQLLSANNFACIGLDADPKCVELSSRFAESHLIEGLNFVDKFSPESFDIIVALHVLEHLQNPGEYVNAMKSLTKRYLILGVPNLATMTGMQFFRVKYVNEGHLHGWDFNHFKTFTELHCGLKLVKWQPDYVIVPKISQLLHKLGARAFIEERVLPKLLPYQSNSIIGLFEKV